MKTFVRSPLYRYDWIPTVSEYCVGIMQHWISCLYIIAWSPQTRLHAQGLEGRHGVSVGHVPVDIATGSESSSWIIFSEVCIAQT